MSRSVLYKRGHNIEPKGYFIVEISKDKRSLFIAAFNSYGPESYLMTLKDNIAELTLQKFSSDFNLMAMCLAFRNDRLLIKDPKNILKNTWWQQSNPEEQINIKINRPNPNQNSDERQ